MIEFSQVEISGAFGLDIIRVGQMGEQARPENIKKVLMALAKGYEHFGVKLDLNSGMKAFDGI
jgi:aspartate aminotransferase-like enzyme